VVALESRVAVDGLACADEAETRIAERHAVVTVPSVQHRFVHFARDRADRRASPDPSRRRIADPRLAIALLAELGLDAAQRIRVIVIERAGHRVRQAVESELLQAREE